MVREEAIVLLSGDPVLNQPPAARIARTLVGLLKAEIKAKPGSNSLVQHFTRELLDFVESAYVASALELLRKMLVSTTGAEEGEEYRAELSALTCGLLSTLADEGASLETLFQLYRQILVPLERPKKYFFERKLGLLARILKGAPTLYRVLFKIDNIKAAEHYPPLMGRIAFSHLARFEYEPERVHLAEEFLVAEAARPDRIRRYPIPKLVPNPDGITGLPDLHAFVQSVDELPNILSSYRESPLSCFGYSREPTSGRKSRARSRESRTCSGGSRRF